MLKRKNNFTNDYRDYCLDRGINEICLKDPWPELDLFPLCKNIKCSLTRENIVVDYKRKKREHYNYNGSSYDQEDSMKHPDESLKSNQSKKDQSKILTEKKKDFGKIDFGIYKGTFWNDLPLDYLIWMISDECRTSQKNKNIAKMVKDQYNVIEDQIPLFPEYSKNII